MFKSMKKYKTKSIKLICFFILLLSFKISKNYYILFKCCIKYIQYYHYLDKECMKCPKEIIFNGLTILSPEETLDEIIKRNRSITRFNDGEINLMYGGRIGFQEANQKLSKKLRKVLKSKRKGLLIGINIPYNNSQLSIYNNYDKNFYIKFINRFKLKLFTLIDLNRKYYSGIISRFYIGMKDKSKIPNYIKKLKQIWNKKDILIIEGEKSRLGVGNDLFNNSKSIKRILCPAINAFNVYEEIINQAKKIDKSNLILLAIGPTSTVLAYDLYKKGFQVIDVGHVDIEYEWFLRKATKKIQIENKYVNEVYGNRYKFGRVKDKQYYEEIIYIINDKNLDK